MDNSKFKKIREFVSKINKQYGEDTLQFGMATPKKMMSTGLSYLDTKLGGIPRGSFTILYGPPAGGKSTLMWQMAAEFQKQDLIVGYINAERSLLDNSWPEKLGVDMSKVVISNPEDAEDSLLWIERFSKAGIDLVILDSVVALATKAEINKNKSPIKKADKKVKGLDNQEPALLPRKLGKWLSTTIPTIDDNKTVVVLINQVRTSLGGFIGYETYSGGNALKHTVVLALKIHRKKDNDVIFTIKKTNINSNEDCSFIIPFIPGRGFDTLYCDLMVILESPKVLNLTKGVGKDKKTKYAFTLKDKVVIKTHQGNALNFIKELIDKGNSVEQIKNKILLKPTDETKKKLEASFKEEKKEDTHENNEEG